MSDIQEMKTLHLLIIIGIVTIGFILAISVMFNTSAKNNVDVSITGLKDTYGMGQPITFFVGIKNPTQNTVYPRAIIVNDNNTKVWDSGYDIPPNGSEAMTSWYYISEYSNNVPMINQTGKYKLIVSYGDMKTDKEIIIATFNKEDDGLHYYGPYEGIDQETGTAWIADQPYFIKTIHGTPSDLTRPYDTAIEFHRVSFTFPGCGRCLSAPTVSNSPYYVKVQFPDKTNETLVIRSNMWPTVSPPLDDRQYFSNGTRIFPNGTKGTWTMTQHKDQIVTTLSVHTDPQAGITVTHDSIKLLVSGDKTSKIMCHRVPIDNDKAVSLATSNNEFQSKISGYNATFSNVFEITLLDKTDYCQTLENVNVVFSLADSAGNFVKLVVVTEDASLTKILNVTEQIGNPSNGPIK